MAPHDKKNELSHALFVYGTLKREYPNHRFIQDGLHVGKAKTVEHYGLYMYEHPLVYAHHPVGPVHGEVYQVSPAILDTVDVLQNHPRHYYREEIGVKLESGEQVKAWIYFYPDKVGRAIVSGVFDLDKVLHEAG